MKEVKSQHLATQDKNAKIFDLKVDGILDKSTENEFLKNRIGSYDEKWLEESKAKLLKQIDDKKRAIIFMSRMEKQLKEHYLKANIVYDKLWTSENFK